ncbi:hypothetical protein Fmac_032464 [Flemingia macrophylla]|uniref:DEAD-box RNA helicase Q domain-containing protein n=1 Tax=Flemingia macrophylla TaxID=520843 RepID=A0ABD1L5E2_9FABA
MGEENEEIKTFKELGLSESLAEACENLGWKNQLKIQIEAILPVLEVCCGWDSWTSSRSPEKH